MRVLFSCLTITLLTIIKANGQPAGQPQNPPPVPITGLEYLVAAGATYGASRFVMNRRKAGKKT
jgi:hypothetical protein